MERTMTTGQNQGYYISRLGTSAASSSSSLSEEEEDSKFAAAGATA
jgi:hypothetical protein